MGFANYEDRLKHLKNISNYHFDPFLKEEPPFRIIGRFEGEDWMPELLRMEEMARGGDEIGFSFYYKETTKRFTSNSQFDLSGQDKPSYDENLKFVARIKPPILSRENAPTLFKMIDWLAFEPESVVNRIHIQHPGQVFPFHVDGLVKHRKSKEHMDEMMEAPEEWARIQIQLCDWTWGHMWAIGNTYWSQWRAGEIMYHPWKHLPHGTANCGFASRYTLQVSGLITELTRERLQLHHKVIPLQQL